MLSPFWPHGNYPMKILEELIKDIDEEDISNANKLGYKIKLMGFSEIFGNKIFFNS